MIELSSKLSSVDNNQSCDRNLKDRYLSVAVQARITTQGLPLSQATLYRIDSFASSYGLVQSDDVLPPLLMNAAAHVPRDFEVETAVRLARRIGQRHPRFFWRAASFLDVAANAGADNVLPAIAAAARSRDDVV